MTVKATVAQLRSIATEAAFIAAATLDKTLSDDERSHELRDSLAILVPQLQAAGLMEAYERDGGEFCIL